MDRIIEQPLAALKSVEGRPVLVFERLLDHPPERVWKAVTDPAEMAHWFPATIQTEPAVGAPMRFSFEGQLDLGDRYAEGEVLRFDPPRLYAFRWVDSEYVFELTPTDAGCRLVFTVTLSGVRTTGDLPSVVRQAPGWDGCLELLAARLDERDATPMDATRFLRRAENYVEEYGLADGTIAGGADGFTVEFERDLVQPPAAVWNTLTDGEPQPAVGAAPPLRSVHGYVCEGEVTDVEVARALEYSWRNDGELAGRVRFVLQAQEPIGTRLILTHTVPAGLPELLPTILAAWHTHLELFFAALYGDVRCPWPTHRTEQLTKVYTDRFAEVGRRAR